MPPNQANIEFIANLRCEQWFCLASARWLCRTHLHRAFLLFSIAQSFKWRKVQLGKKTKCFEATYWKCRSHYVTWQQFLSRIFLFFANSFDSFTFQNDFPQNQRWVDQRQNAHRVKKKTAVERDGDQEECFRPTNEDFRPLRFVEFGNSTV